MKKLIKGFRRFSHKGLAAAAALLLVFSAVSLLSTAAHGAYTYTVRLFAGSQGTFSQSAFTNVLVDSKNAAVNTTALGIKVEVKSDEAVITGIPASDSYGKPYRVVYNPNMVRVSNSKYLVRGLRESGKDNETINKANFDVSSDMDLVVGYYIASGVVAYTVNYVDENNQPIFTVVDGQSVSSETHYGNAGERVVLAFPYIEGYQPRAYNGIMTLDSDASKNVFSFPYTRIVVEETTTSATEATTSSQAASSSSEGQTTSEGGENTESSSEGGGNGESSGEGSSENAESSGGENESGSSGNENESGGEGGSSGNENESGGEGGSSGNENESGGEESGSENETSGGEESTSSEIEETIEITTSEGPAGSTDFSESESESGSENDVVNRILNVLKNPIFIFGSLGGVTAIALLIVLLTRMKKKKNDANMNIEEKDE